MCHKSCHTIDWIQNVECILLFIKHWQFDLWRLHDHMSWSESIQMSFFYYFRCLSKKQRFALRMAQIRGVSSHIISKVLFKSTTMVSLSIDISQTEETSTYLGSGGCSSCNIWISPWCVNAILDKLHAPCKRWQWDTCGTPRCRRPDAEYFLSFCFEFFEVWIWRCHRLKKSQHIIKTCFSIQSTQFKMVMYNRYFPELKFYDRVQKSL